MWPPPACERLVLSPWWKIKLLPVRQVPTLPPPQGSTPSPLFAPDQELGLNDNLTCLVECWATGREKKAVPGRGCRSRPMVPTGVGRMWDWSQGYWVKRGRTLSQTGKCVVLGTLFPATGFITLARPPEVGASIPLGRSWQLGEREPEHPPLGWQDCPQLRKLPQPRSMQGRQVCPLPQAGRLCRASWLP